MTAGVLQFGGKGRPPSVPPVECTGGEEKARARAGEPLFSLPRALYGGEPALSADGFRPTPKGLGWGLLSSRPKQKDPELILDCAPKVC